VSGYYLDLVVTEEEGKAVDIYDCTFFGVEGLKRDRDRRIEIDPMFS
jgi:hypothetical protein